MIVAQRKDSKGRNLQLGETQRPNGSYRYSYTDQAGIRHEITSWRLVKTDTTPPGKVNTPPLRDLERQIRRDMEDGIKTGTTQNITLDKMFRLYIDGRSSIKQSTLATYRYTYDKYISSELGKRKLSSIKYSDVKAFYSRLIKENNYKPATLKIIQSVLHPVFALAVKDNYIRTNPADGVLSEIRKNHNWENEKRHALTEAQQSAFIDYVSNSNRHRHWKPLFTVFLGTGCRAAELLGLRWEDCNFENKTISINHNLIYRKFDDGKYEFHVTSTKTGAGTRTVPMFKEVKKALLKEKKKQMLLGLHSPTIDGYTGFIFLNSSGQPHNLITINKAISAIIEAYNKQETQKAAQEHRELILLPHFSVHNLRHTFCTRLCEHETNVKLIQDIMGHADFKTTMDIYAEVTENKKQESFEHLEGKIKIS